MIPEGNSLKTMILNTLEKCSAIVGATLGPGGKSIIIERQEFGLPPIVTKDGVTVFRSLGFTDPAAHVLMEAMREAAIRTANEAGDGTTSSTILAEALTRHTLNFTEQNPHISPQKVIRVLQTEVNKKIVPKIESLKFQPDLGSDFGRSLAHSVAKVSANGDVDLADAVMKCFDLVGDNGNVTIVETEGAIGGYQVSKIDGYPIGLGYEECGKFAYQSFVNEIGRQMTLIERPMFLLVDGDVTDWNTLLPVFGRVLNELDLMYKRKELGEDVDVWLTPNIVVVAHSFSDDCIANMAKNFANPNAPKIFPLLTPLSPIATGRRDFLMDIAALTGASIFDLIQRPLTNFDMSDLGYGPTAFEATRWRSNIIGFRDELLLFERVDQITKQLSEAAISTLEKTILKERLARLTSGIAKLTVTGASNGETKERRDRAEDAVCALRGALNHGALPGGGSVLAQITREILADTTGSADEIAIRTQVLAPSLLAPVTRLYDNAGYSEAEIKEMIEKLGVDNVYDVLEHTWGDPRINGVFDSLPAVRESLRSALSIATQTGTCGGVIVFGRDEALERSEAKNAAEWERASR